MSAVHLVAGATGAGKTTYARALADEIGGIRFSIDDWMNILFWMDSPQPIEFTWTMERIARCETAIRAECAQILGRGLPVVLDLGFTRAEHRASFADWAEARGMPCVLHHLDIASDVRWSRVEARNRDKGETYNMDVDRSLFDFMEGQWQAPDAAEMERLSGIRVAR